MLEFLLSFIYTFFVNAPIFIQTLKIIYQLCLCVCLLNSLFSIFNVSHNGWHATFVTLILNDFNLNFSVARRSPPKKRQITPPSMEKRVTRSPPNKRKRVSFNFIKLNVNCQSNSSIFHHFPTIGFQSIFPKIKFDIHSSIHLKWKL